MINELHSCLLYRKQRSGDVPGEDLQESGLSFPSIDPAAKSVQRSILLEPSRPETANWRVLEIRKALKRSDLKSMLHKFDQRTGFMIDDLLSELTKKFRPQVTGGPSPHKVRITGKYRNKFYRHDHWTLEVEALQWKVHTSGREPVTGNITGETLVRAPLPGHDGHVLFPGNEVGTYIISWAASPILTFADTAQELRTTSKQGLYSLAENGFNRFNSDERALLYRIATGGGEAVAQVCAAALLFAGHTARYVSSSDTSTTAA